MWEKLYMVEVLLQLGGDLGIVNCVGNDFLAVAASMAERVGAWNDILENPELLAKCSAKHAGRVALQLYATYQFTPQSVILKQMPAMWRGEHSEFSNLPHCPHCSPVAGP